MNLLELTRAVVRGSVHFSSTDETMMSMILESAEKMRREIDFLHRYARTPSRKWEVPMSAVTWEPWDDGYRAGIIVTPSGLTVRVWLHPYNDTLPASGDVDGRSGYIGCSIHDEMLHIGTPGFALSEALVIAMESLEREGIARPLPTKIGIIDADGNEVKMTIYAQPLPKAKSVSIY